MTDRTVTDRQEAPGTGRRAGVHAEERADPALEGDTSPVRKQEADRPDQCLQAHWYFHQRGVREPSGSSWLLSMAGGTGSSEG